jgi:hypothetical protein
MSLPNAKPEENVSRTMGLGAILRLSTGLLLLIPFAIGCASTNSVPMSPRTGGAGPGSLFSTIDAAALDAVAWSYHASLEESPRTRRAQAGTIREVAGGFTYDTPSVAPKDDQYRVRYSVGEDAVAHFRMNPKAAIDNDRLERALEHFSARDRDMVDHHDPQHRPIYMLTPSLKIRSYVGKVAGPQVIARLNRDRGTNGIVFSIAQAD